MQLRKDLDGLRVQLPGNLTIYLMLDGKKCAIPDMQTYGNLFNPNAAVTQDIGVDKIENGEPLTSGAILIDGDGVGVFLLSNNEKRPIGSPETMKRYDFNWGKILTLPIIVISSIKTGAGIVWPEGA